MNLGKKIFKIRKDNKMSQEDFADIFNVTRQTISSWENSKSYPDIETLIKISDRFGISLDILLKGDNEMINIIDKQIKNSKKFKLITILSICLLVIISGFFVTNKYIKIKQDNMRYEKIISNINKLGFSKDEIGFASITEDGINYRIFIKRPQILEKEISASSIVFTDEEAIVATYDGKDIKITYINENNTTVYCNKIGEIDSTQSKDNINIYNKYKERTISIVTRMVELFESIYK